MAKTADVIVVGAGTAGCIVARRLVDAGVSVIVLEAGGEDTNPAIHDVMRAAELWHAEEDWDHHTTPQAHANGRRLHLPRGKVLGGSHALNATIWVRGSKADFDGWEALGNPGWSWDDVLPVFKDIEAYDGPPSELRGTGGLLDVTADYEPDPVQQSILEATLQAGIPLNPDYNSGELDGVNKMQYTMRDGRRLSTYVAYLKPILGDERLTVVTGAHVHRLLMEGATVVGVELERDGATEQARAGTVVLSGGTIGSPRLLLRSGIGPAEELAAIGVEPVVDSPGVGKNFHDHLLSPVIFATTKREVGPPRPGISPAQTHHFWRSRDGLPSPDTQPINFTVPMYSEEWMTGPEFGFTMLAGLVRPESRGAVTLSGPTPDAPLLLDLAVFDDERDLAALVASLVKCREIGAQPALVDEWGAVELYPGPSVRSADELRAYARSTAITYHHQVGTCRMGTDDLAVVDPASLEVHGTTGLRVADASVIPRVTSGNTNAPAALIGEKAAAAYLADRGR